MGPKRLAGKVTTILQRIEKELDAVDLHIGDSMHILDADNDGMVRPSSTWCTMSFGNILMFDTCPRLSLPWVLLKFLRRRETRAKAGAYIANIAKVLQDLIS